MTQKNNFVGRFFHRDVNIFDGGQKIREFGQFVIVGSKKRARASVFLQMFDNGPGNREAVERGGAAADFIQQNETGGSSVSEDAGDFAHFHEKSGAAAREIITCANARENAVGDGKLGLARGNKTTHLRHQNDQSGLTKIRRFAAHVGAGDE